MTELQGIATMTVLLLGPVTTERAWLDRYGDTLRRLLDNCALWWASKGILLNYDPPAAVEFAVNPLEDNPWPRVFAELLDRGYDTGPAHLYLAVLDGWDHPLYAGWGGRPLAVVGEWFLRALETLGSPEAIVDDALAGFLACHELGHALGLPHDFETPDSVMGYGWTPGFNFILGPLWDRVLTEIRGLAPAAVPPQSCPLRFSVDPLA